ncbi:hypothetical protein LH51_04085 [Nitrincola sp. A-D6]|uniref:hypothetical protein n=1 Tax=Nitrincola sp. A-D6 TaxID=1545442 RepID=UPI00051FBB65|nr:hypothetical protein [Nitrincola sp. A-D6]KGK42844.1 hypothetical protein LH51_04085 [Nitrincola sp. A-D6]
MDSVLINAKGFGGNNASAVILSPQITETLLSKRYSSAQMQHWQLRREKVKETAQAYDLSATRGISRPLYLYDHQVLTGEDLSISDQEIKLPGYPNPVSINVENPYKDFTN